MVFKLNRMNYIFFIDVDSSIGRKEECAGILWTESTLQITFLSLFNPAMLLLLGRTGSIDKKTNGSQFSVRHG
jgi:hypothetical protein